MKRQFPRFRRRFLQPKRPTQHRIFVCFWNVENLFDVNFAPYVGRGPESTSQLEEKLGRIADALQRTNNGYGPDLIALAEIQSHQLLARLARLLRTDYHLSFHEPTLPSHTGLGLLTRKSCVSPAIEMGACHGDAKRPRALLWHCMAYDTPLVIAVNHWKSRMPARFDDELDRVLSAKWLGTQLLQLKQGTNVLVVGDFNAEPFERPFRCAPFSGSRFRHQVLRTGAARSTLYNTAWRFLTDAPPGRIPQPFTSHASSSPVIFDQVLASKSLLTGSAGMKLLDETVSLFHCPEIVQEGAGSLIPRAWSSSRARGASDHFPVVAELSIRRKDHESKYFR